MPQRGTKYCNTAKGFMVDYPRFERSTSSRRRSRPVIGQQVGRQMGQQTGRQGRRRLRRRQPSDPLRRSTVRSTTIEPTPRSRSAVPQLPPARTATSGQSTRVRRTVALPSSRISRPTQSPAQRYTASRSVVRSRLLLVWSVLVLGLVGLLGNLVRLQVVRGDELQQRAEAQHGISLRPFIPRRTIIDRQGHAVAMDRQEYTLYAHPIGFKDSSPAHKANIAQKLAPIIGRTPTEILERLNLRDSGIPLKTGLSEEEADRVRALYIDGLDLSPYQARFYPYGSLFAHIVGYVNFEREGQVGVELSHTEVLHRPTPTLNMFQTARGLITPDGVPEQFAYHDHLDLKLTVDGRLQRYVRTLLAQETARHSAKRSIAIVMDVNTGAIRAMVTEPSYDPNVPLTEADIPRLVNSAVTHLYEPGSTFKPVNVAIALETGRLQASEMVYDSGQVRIGTWTIRNHDYTSRGPRGSLSITDVLKYSSNVGMIRIMNRLDSEQYFDWLGNLGLGKVTGIDLPFEASALMKSREQFTGSPVESATTSFGQGLSITPLQLVQMQAAIANGGFLVTPHVVDGLFDRDGQRHWSPDRPDPFPVFSDTTSRLVVEMMERVVSEGTGKAAQVPGYRIAGKTGTAQKVGNHGVYADGLKVTSFVSIFPVEAPQFVVLVMVDEPKGGNAFGGTVAAPIVQKIIEHIIALENILPAQAP
ncbi:MAG: peptidoglycan D,D-transpeptidase FtsI family protein [Leptolyngbyaceae cyanobacterium]